MATRLSRCTSVDANQAYVEFGASTNPDLYPYHKFKENSREYDFPSLTMDTYGYHGLAFAPSSNF